MMSRPTRRGATLLEVIAAMTLLLIGGVAGTSLMAQVLEAIRTAQMNDREAAAAALALERMSLWSRARLDDAVGERARDSLTVSVARVNATLYRVTILHSRRRSAVLASTFYRPEDRGVPLPP